MTELEQNVTKFDEDIKANDWQLIWCPDDELVWLWRGKIFWGVQRYDEAARAFSQGITRCPHYGPLYRDRGHVLINGGRFAEAAADYAQAHRLMGAEWDTLYHYALSCFLIGDYARAAALFREASGHARNAGDTLAAANWAWASLLHAGETDEAAAVLRTIPDEMPMPEDAEGYYRVVFTAKGKLTPEQGMGQGGIVSAIQSMSSAYGVSNYCRYVLGDARKADALCEEMLRVGAAEMYHTFGYRAAQAEMGKTDRPAPQPEWDEKIAQERWNEYNWFRKAHTHADHKELGSAIYVASQALVYVRDPARFLQHRGHWFTNVGEYEKSASDFTRAALLRPDDKNILYHYGIAHYLLAEYKMAEKIFRRTVDTAATYTESISALNWVWACLVHQGKKADAEALLAGVPNSLTGLNDSTAGYYNLLMLYKGLRDPQSLLPPPGEAYAVEHVTCAYGVANYYYYVAGDIPKADATLDRILAGVKPPFTSAFGYRAALNERERRAAGR
ncbi:MAG: tetratricopeptide repeat protein [Oscillospiraceae bacterium]|jgi:tetratricopeptide (TPR) repeat protein|nr:tetratricopeptide repeat protein [Oscillospiraceae bacterium]